MRFATLFTMGLLAPLGSSGKRMGDFRPRGLESKVEKEKKEKKVGPSVAKGNFGQLNKANENSTKNSAKKILKDVLKTHFKAIGNEEVVVKKIGKDKKNGIHIRFAEEVNGMPVEGASLMLHAEPDGTVFTINGDFVKGDVPTDPLLGANEALSDAIDQFGQVVELFTDPEWFTDPELVVVRGEDGYGYLAWKVVVDYEALSNGLVRPHRDEIFADSQTGNLVARFPLFKHALSMETRDCNESTNNCPIVETSTSKISNSDLALEAAHNYAIDTYNYFSEKHNRDSIDDAGMTLVSRVHYGNNYNNAFWDGSQMTYGDGDGTIFIPLSRDADVVAHELTHGVTERESNLVYQYESGALNEAMSDIFGAMVDRFTGATGDDIWLIGEDIYTPGTPGDALRSMADPASQGDYDYYPDRYTGSQDNGGVHWNSGIANLAFKLLVTGGSHPRGKTSVMVEGIDFDAAAEIFYQANVNCMTTFSNFLNARECTLLFAGDNETNVNASWAAVGVPPPPPPPPTPLTDGVPVTGLSLNSGLVKNFFLSVSEGDEVTCSIAGNNGDADLYTRFDELAVVSTSSTENECASYSSNSNEVCSTGAAPSDTELFVAVHAYSSFSGLTLTCTIATGPGPTCSPRGGYCTVPADCCSDSCRRRKNKCR